MAIWRASTSAADTLAELTIYSRHEEIWATRKDTPEALKRTTAVDTIPSVKRFAVRRCGGESASVVKLWGGRPAWTQGQKKWGNFRMTDPIDVQEIMRAVKYRVRNRTTPEFQEQIPASALPKSVAPDWTGLEESGRRLEEAQTLIGQVPPEPPTFRGRLGALLVHAVRRALSWYTPQIIRFHGATSHSFNELAGAIKTVAAAGQQSRAAVDNVDHQVAKLWQKIGRLEEMLEARRDEIQALVKLAVLPEVLARQVVESRLGDATREIERLAQALVAETCLREELASGVDAEVQSRAGLAQALAAETGVREELARRVDAEIAAREVLAQALGAEVAAREEQVSNIAAQVLTSEGLTRRIDAEMAARESLAQALSAKIGAREEWAQTVDAEIATREGLKQALAAETGVREELTRRVDAEIVAREGLAQALGVEMGAREELAVQVGADVVAREALRQDVMAISSRSQAVQSDFRQSDIRVLQLRNQVINQDRRVSILLEEARKRLPAPFDDQQLVTIINEDKHKLDALYVSFEDMFRGTRADIKERCRVYLPFLEQRGIGTEQMPILDVGCGRGEWLELLLEHKLEARGIDINRVLLAQCKDAGLNVAEGDILDQLKNQSDQSLGAVTGFHIIEHLPLDLLIRVFDETVRVLKPGGIVIFETPNPRNVLVGTHNFYLDFTHRNPLPSLTTQFILEARGLCDVQILDLHPYPQSSMLQDDGTEIAKRFNEYFYGSQDYAVIGRKV